jgi:hypothetical protein
MLHWKELIGCSDEQLAALDVAEVNLACAADFPDAPTAEMVTECLDRLNHYAKWIKVYTEERLPFFRANSKLYGNQESVFRVVTMISLLQQMYGVQYNPEKIPDDVPFDLADTFIHGALLGQGGTCATLPVVYAAVGRRLGYPIKLVWTRQHQFCRWEGNGERFNIEANNFSIDSPPDDKYRNGKYAVEDPSLERAYRWLESNTPRMELSGFLMQRGYRWFDLGNFKESTDSFAWAAVVDQQNQAPRYIHDGFMRKWRQRLGQEMPPNFPEMTVTFPPRRYPPPITDQMEQAMIVFSLVEDALSELSHQHWWEALRSSPYGRPAFVPSAIHVTLTQ